jgi:hypothetical protein
MVLQAFIDDSTSDGVYVLGGHIASAESWAKFSREWEELLPLAMRDRDGRYYFKMREMNRADKLPHVPAFYKVLEDNVLCSLSASYNLHDLERAKERIYVPGLQHIDWSHYNNRYFYAFRLLMDMFHSHREKIVKVVPLDQKIDFYFDNQKEKGLILAMWDDYMAKRPPETRQHYGATPRFEDDKDFLPLQAADMWAWWIRKWIIEGNISNLEKPDFGGWQAKRDNHLKIHIDVTEDQIVEHLTERVAAHIEPGRAIYDLKLFPEAKEYFP